MEVRTKLRGLVKWTACGALLTGQFACHSSSTTAPLVATSNVNASLTAANIGALVPASGASPSTFTFSNGFSGTNSAKGNAAINLTGATAVTITGTAAAPTFTITSGGATLTGTLGFGSCDFTVVTLTGSLPGVTLPATLVVTPCNLTLNTSGQPSGTATVTGSLVLGSSTSVPEQFNVTISSNGTVLLGSVPVGTVTLGASTGSSGSGG